MYLPKILQSGERGVDYISAQKLNISVLILYQTKNFLDGPNLKALADDKINVTEKLKFVLGRVESIMGKGENAVYQHFLLFPYCFQTAFFSGSLKVRIVW